MRDTNMTVTHKNNGSAWATAVSDFFLQKFWALWELRNHDRHGKDLAQQADAEKRQAIRELYQLYERQEAVQDTYPWIFGAPIETLLNGSTKRIRGFITNYKPIVDKGYQDRLITR